MPLKRSHIFLLSCSFFIFGVGLASFLPVELWHYKDIVFLLVFLFIIVLGGFWRKRRVRIAALCGLFLFLGVLRFGLSLPVDSPDRISHYRGGEVNMEARISDRPVSKTDNQQLEVEAVRLKDRGKKVSGKILVTTQLYPEYHYGQKVNIRGELQKPPDFPDFAYSRYLAKSGIYTVSYYPSIQEQGAASLSLWQKIKAGIFSFKDKAVATIERGLGEPQAALVKAMVLGDKSTVPLELKNDLSRAGISHLTAISGMHIGILAAIVFQILLSLGLHRQRVFWVSVLFLIFYVVLIGMPASAVRAGIMGVLVLLSFNLGRFHRIENILVLAAGVMLAVNPKLFRDDLGFQLSFLAVAGIWYFYPRFNNFFQKFHRDRPMVKTFFDIFNITLCAQVLTLPLIAHNFSHIAVIAPVANLAVLWVLPLVLVFSLAGLVAGIFFSSWVWWLFLPANILVSYIYYVGDILGSWSWGHIPVHLPWWLWPVYYLVLAWIVFKGPGLKYLLLNFRQKNSKIKAGI